MLPVLTSLVKYSLRIIVILDNCHIDSILKAVRRIYTPITTGTQTGGSDQNPKETQVRSL